MIIDALRIMYTLKYSLLVLLLPLLLGVPLVLKRLVKYLIVFLVYQDLLVGLLEPQFWPLLDCSPRH